MNTFNELEVSCVVGISMRNACRSYFKASREIEKEREREREREGEGERERYIYIFIYIYIPV